ncbi:NAD-dependent succinate-semialdehyde dehydrogenase [Sporosarcina sp. Marseille-Q4063]|uniref:NAD-dependent succinate-semialdehyde dehydrogenase n=1 Tax=Sporosarcina sp. Marseille-Q4063 TaxID=2810514 RepID=UPI001BAF182A|nr:NAD-dependent succinate-semialdehyde dehydrogenase [Sporosarcina sp. Marseille-Q4063]QUW21270.1 NAD-dependent succinate-semialdehyde dehydrogenase [Sporosarcina sp. Marseille-Q4063]
MTNKEEFELGLLYIDGQWIESKSSNFIDVHNPSTNEVIGKITSAGRKDTKKAIEAATKASPAWKSMPAKERAIYLEKIAAMMIERKEEIARVLSIEQGKPLREAIGETLQAADFLKWYAEEGKRVYGNTIPASDATKKLLTWYEPVGVTAAITPWNFPVSMVTRKLGPALAAGCTVVLKPSEFTPFTAIKLFQIFEEAGLPKGVANLVFGVASEIGEEFLQNNEVKKISFTGSTQVGKYLYKEAANQVKRISLELGGHAPFIVFEDADIEKAVEGLIVSKFRNAGQTCVSANRIYVHEDILNQFVSSLAGKVKEFKIGCGLDADTDLGPVINEAAIIKIEDQVADALEKNANLVTGGKSVKAQGYFYEPTILTNMTKDMKINKEETFGPVLPIWTFQNDDEVIGYANDTNFGLAAYYYTKDLKRSYSIAEKLEYGIIGLNDPNPAVAQAPFGGFKESGIGREGGFQGIMEYLEAKYLSIQL